MDTHLHGHEEYFDNQRHHRDVVLGVLKGFTREDPFENGEKDLNQVVEGLALSLNFKFKCLENTFERAQSRGLVSLIVGHQPFLDLLMSVLSPRRVVKLRDIVDDVLDAAHDDLAAWVCHMHHIVKCAKNVLFEHLAVSLAD